MPIYADKRERESSSFTSIPRACCQALLRSDPDAPLCRWSGLARVPGPPVKPLFICERLIPAANRRLPRHRQSVYRSSNL